MESQDNFYISLPSNSSFKYFPNNTLANFKVMLARPLQLTGNYEVALVEMYFSRVWSNVVGDEASIEFHQNGKEAFKLALEEGYYSEANTLLDTYNKQLLTYMETDRRDAIHAELADVNKKIAINKLDINDED